MKLTIAIVTRNRAYQLRRCLASLTNQTVKPDKVFVIDNNSTDNTKETVNLYKKKLPINYFVEEKVGIPIARNLALQKAREGIIAFLDDDCQALPSWVANITKAHKKYPNIMAIQGWSISKPEGSLIALITQFNFITGFQANFLQQKTPYSLSVKYPFWIDSQVMFLSTKNCSFKLKKIKDLQIRFNDYLVRRSDTDFAKQILHTNEQIIFCPEIKVNHWERKTIIAFFYQTFISGKWIMKVYKKWPPKYFPKRHTLWQLHRTITFLKYCFQNGYAGKIILLFPLFLINQIILTVAKLIGTFNISKTNY